jgi:hypothetical protein
MANRSKTTASVTIANGAALSGAVNLSDKVLTAIIVPATWTAASLTFQASEDGVTWYDMFDSAGNEETILSANVVAGRRMYVDPSDFASVDYIKVRSGSTGTPVNQGAARVVTLVSRKFYALD